MVIIRYTVPCPLDPPRKHVALLYSPILTATTSHQTPHIGPLLGQRRELWANVKPPLV